MLKRTMSLISLVAVAGCDGGSPDSPGPPMQGAQASTQSATAPASRGLAALTGEQLEHARGPITYFNDKCGRCHGNYGNYYLEGVIAGLGERKLREEVDLMAAGPSQAPLEGLALDVQVAYHRSLADGRPFVTVFRDDSGLAGEVTPESRVLLRVSGREQEAQVEGHRWSSTLRDAATVRVERAGAITELPLGELKAGDRSAVLHSHVRPGK